MQCYFEFIYTVDSVVFVKLDVKFLEILKTIEDWLSMMFMHKFLALVHLCARPI